MNIGDIHMAGTDPQGVGLAGSSYLRGMDANQQFDMSNHDDNWDKSEESEPDNFENVEERNEFMFENRAKYKG